MRRSLFIIGIGVLALAVTGLARTWAGFFSVGPLVLVTGPSPFASCTVDNVAGQPGINFPNSAVEPWVDVNPKNILNIVGGWQQDRWSNGGARGLVAGVSFDGGVKWESVVIPGITLCSGGDAANGGDFKRATDPWLSFAPNGDLYFFSLSLDVETPPNRSGGFGKNALFVSKSRNGGLTWSDPIKITEDTNPRFLNDKNAITADPGDANFVYAVWDRLQLPVGAVINPENVIGLGFKGPAMFSRTTNGGQTWEAPRVIYDPGANGQTIGNQIVVHPSGTLVNFFTEALGAKNVRGEARLGLNLALVFSTDKGGRWTRGQPIRAAKMLSVGVRDPDTGTPIRSEDILAAVAVDRNPISPGYGSLYAVWQDGRFSGFAHDAVAFSKSTDGGLSWTAPVRVNLTPAGVAAFNPSVRVAADGTVGVTYYDFRNHTSGSAALETDYFIVHSHDGGGTWQETRITPAPFNMRKAPLTERGYFLGDYEGLAAVGIGSDLRPFFAQSGTAPNTSDVFTTSVGP